MSVIKESEGVIFSVENRNLTAEERKLLAEFIVKQEKRRKLRKKNGKIKRKEL